MCVSFENNCLIVKQTVLHIIIYSWNSINIKYFAEKTTVCVLSINVFNFNKKHSFFVLKTNNKKNFDFVY